MKAHGGRHGRRRRQLPVLALVPVGSNAVELATLKAANSSTLAVAGAPSGRGLALGVPSCPEAPGAR